VRVALTGATGYTGAHLLATLRHRGDEVTALVRKGSTAAPRVASTGARVVEGDLADANAVRALVDGADAVLHVAAVYRTAGHPDSYYREVNVTGARRLAEAAAQAGVKRFVHTSTVGVHGNVARPPADEAAPMNPGDIYQVTKVEGERAVRELHGHRGMEVVVVRPGAIYGPGETRLLKLFRAIARRRYAIVGTGRAFYHLVYIDDLVQGFLLALARPEAAGEAFIIAGPACIAQGDLAQLIAKHTGGGLLPFHVPAWPLRWAGAVCEAFCVPFGLEPPLHRRRVDFWVKNRAFRIAKARRLLGYDPHVGLDEGIARTAAWYREAGWL
jgi:nucleoside-diphosphate-sugar epimerase